MKYFIALTFAIIIAFGVAGCEDEKEKVDTDTVAAEATDAVAAEATDTVATEATDAVALSEDVTPVDTSSDVVGTND